MLDVSKSIIQQLEDKRLEEHGVKLFVKRDDLIHPVVAGRVE